MVNQLPVSLLAHLNLSFTYCTMAEKKLRERPLGSFSKKQPNDFNSRTRLKCKSLSLA